MSARRLASRRLTIAISVCVVVLLRFEARFPGDCGDTISGWSCDTAGTIAIYTFVAVAVLLVLLFVVALWRLGGALARRLRVLLDSRR